MYNFDTLNKNNLDELIKLNKLRTNFNKLNKDFLSIYCSLNQLQKIIFRKKIYLLKNDSKYIGYIWVGNKINYTYSINSMYIIENPSIEKAYNYLLSKFNCYPKLTYRCEKNSYNFDVLEHIGFLKKKGVIEMSINTNNLFEFETPKNVHFKKLIRGKDENLRCIIQNNIFESEDRIPLYVEDIYYDEMQNYYCEDLAIFMKKDNICVGYGQIIFKKGFPYIVNFGLIKEYRNKSYGKLFLKYMLNALYKKGKTLCKIKVDSRNHAAIKLYTTLGFSSDREQNTWYLKP